MCIRDSHKVPARLKFLGFSVREGFEIHGDQLLRRGIQALIEDVFEVLLFARDVALRGEHPSALLADRNMDVRGASGIDGWFDRAKVVAALRVGRKTAIPLKVSILLFLGSLAMEVNAVAIYLPDFHQSVSNRVSFQVLNRA